VRARRGALALLVGLALASARPAVAQEVATAPPPLPTAAVSGAPPPAAAPESQPLAPPLLRTKSLQPGERGYKSLAWAAAWSFGITILPVVMGGFLTNNPKDGIMWTGFGLIAAAQSFGPSAGFWYAGEKPRFTWWRLALSGIALAAAGYPLYAYTGRIDQYNTSGAAALVAIAIAAEAATLALAAWDLSHLGEAVERHNERPVKPASQPRLRAAVAPIGVPGGGGLGVLGRF
jgi:hypothetical protein